MRREHTPSTVAAPFSRYSHGVEAAAERWLLISGQVGVDREGRLAEGAAAQMEQAWRNIFAILADAGMDAGNLVKITAYLTRREDLKAFREVRDRNLAEVKPASTLVIVSGLADPGWLVEIEAVAAR
jgi:enamine deaminase RidA (YjgF/YER057c/UK114 family)